MQVLLKLRRSVKALISILSSWCYPQSRFNDVCRLWFVYLCKQNLVESNNIIEHLDVQAISSRGIKIGYTPEVLTDAGTPVKDSAWPDV